MRVAYLRKYRRAQKEKRNGLVRGVGERLEIETVVGTLSNWESIEISSVRVASRDIHFSEQMAQYRNLFQVFASYSLVIFRYPTAPEVWPESETGRQIEIDPPTKPGWLKFQRVNAFAMLYIWNVFTMPRS